jgi:hypothetical protein
MHHPFGYQQHSTLNTPGPGPTELVEGKRYELVNATNGSRRVLRLFVSPSVNAIVLETMLSPCGFGLKVRT